MTNTTLEQTLAPLAADLADIQDRIAVLQLAEAALKAKIRELVPGPDQYTAGNLVVTISTNNRFDPKKALTLIPEALTPLVVENIPTVNRDKLKALAPDIYTAAQSSGDYRISLK